MKDCIDQINNLRENYQHLDSWENAENSEILIAAAFKDTRDGDGIYRKKLTNDRL